MDTKAPELTIDEYEFLSMAIRELDNRESNPDRACWLTGEMPDGSGVDEGTTYCWECAQKHLKELTEGVEEPDLAVTGSRGAECDSPEICEDCGALLDYTLTDYGVRQELAHFSEADTSPFDWSDSNQCYELARVAHGIYKNPEQSRLLIAVLSRSVNFPDTWSD